MNYLWPKSNSLRKLKSLLLTSIILIPITAVALTKADDETVPYVGEVSGNAVDSVEKLPFCSDDSQHTINRRLLYVTTLDGKLSALDIVNNGKLHWSVPTEPGPLISSSIHRLELTNNGQWVRMIPSLSGGLYKFNGETLDPIPITAENLLSSSFKFSDDLVISGGKETRTYGVSVRTGQVLYKCSISGCVNETDTNSRFGPPRTEDDSTLLDVHDPLIDDVMVVRRQTQTVRAIEPRTGHERWNFSVGHHEMEILKSPDCHNRAFSDIDLAVLDLDIRVVVPEGVVYAFSKQDMKTVLWKYKFDHPIVSAWRTDASDNVQTIDLFGTAQWLWNNENGQQALVDPSVYLGMYQKQLYIQESRSLAQLITDETRNLSPDLTTSGSKLPQIPWKPYPASSSALAIVNHDDDNNNKIIEDEDPNTAALSVLYASEYVNGNGFYLYSQEDLNKTNNALCDSGNETESQHEEFDFNFEEADTPVKIIVISLWYWWKEIVVIALTTALIVNLVLSPKVRREREFVVIEKHIPVPTANEATEDLFTNKRITRRSISESNSTSSEGYVSRFSTDFDFIQCLGKGGFGVVFEAKNKLDDCNYAVKRIVLPNKKESRDRVLREVKTLANCEHHNIVRYFQAWLETPPPGWQETEDKKWMAQIELPSTSIDIETPDGTTLPPFPKDSYCSENVMDNRNKKLESWISSLNGVPEDASNFNDDMIKNQSLGLDWKVDESCSFIQFREDSKASTDSCNTKRQNVDDLDDDDSFQIEFKHSKSGMNSGMDVSKNSIVSNASSISKSNHVGKSKNMKRHMSLDLTSQADVIVPMPERSQQRVYLYIQMQLCQKQSLREWMRESSATIRHPRVKSVFEQIVDAVDYVHLKGLIHRDLKPSNIFFSLDGQIKIGDFGLVSDTFETPSPGAADGPPPYFCTRRTQQVGTRLYMSPEQLEGRPYDFKVDIFSLGLIFYELLVDFDTEMERIITLEKLRKGDFPNHFQDNFALEHNLLRSMLAPQPIHRPTTSDIKALLTSVDRAGGDNLVFRPAVAAEKLIQMPCKLENVVRSTLKYGITEND